MLWFPALLLLQAVDMPAVGKNPHTTQADIAQGRKLFLGRCAGCHGPGGDGGKGANLATATLSRATDDLSLYRVIRYGIPDTEMPRHLMSEREVWQVAAFVRRLGQVERAALPGDPERGRQLARGKAGCLQCHAIAGEGGHIGPPLTDIGKKRSAAWLRAKLLDAAAEVADEFRTVQLTTRAGQKLSGVRVNEDTWSIQVRDAGGKPHSFWKADVTNLKLDRATLMPSYRGRLSDTELNDIVAYLAGLRGDQ
ncbi:MAG TPA: c-type cytochrome [Bryobacteraceae bacterium]|nr:c-type cytochrome [Bryobacteraceae bacterium]